MKTKITLFIAIITIMATSFGCKKTNCCVLAEETNTILALKNNAEWRTTGYLYKYNSHTDTVSLAGNNSGESFTVTMKKTGNSYVMIDATFYYLIGDIVTADYILDTSKNNSFATTANNDTVLEGNFTLYFKLNHNSELASAPANITFKNGLFRIKWNNVPHVVLP